MREPKFLQKRQKPRRSDTPRRASDPNLRDPRRSDRRQTTVDVNNELRQAERRKHDRREARRRLRSQRLADLDALSGQEIFRLVRAAKAGHQLSYYQLVMLTWPLLNSICNDYRRFGAPIDDLQSVAALAFVDVVAQFKKLPETGDDDPQLLFAAFAASRVRGALRDFRRQNRADVVLPKRLSRGQVSNVSLDSDLGRRLAEKGGDPLSILSRGVGEHRLRRLLAAIDQLPPREAALIGDHHLRDQPLSLTALAEKHGVTLQVMSRIHVRAIKHLKQILDQRRKKPTASAGDAVSG